MTRTNEEMLSIYIHVELGQASEGAVVSGAAAGGGCGLC
jgi:hypothetical protein